MRTSPKTVVNTVLGPPAVALDDDALARIAALSGFRIPATAVQELAHVIREYMIATTFEREAISNNEIAAEVEMIKKLAGRLWSRLNRETGSIHDGAKDAINLQLALADRENAPERLTDVDHFVHVLTRMFNATLAAKNEIDKRGRGGFGDHGRAWRTFIRSLDEWAVANGLPLSPGRGDTDKQSDIRPSEYVTFVAALLAEIPKGYKIEYQSDMALRGRIIDARS